MSWVLDNIPLLVFAFVLFSVIRAIVRAAQLSAGNKATTSETEEQRRVREIQERIRKKIAERRGSAAPLAPSPEEPAAHPPMLQPSRVPPLEPFGGPSRRTMIEEMRRMIQPEEPAPIDTAELERQQKLAEQIRTLDEARVATGRRAAQAVTQRENALASSSAASAPHALWLGNLRDPQTLRRAFVLREVLGPPVGLR